MGDSPNGDGSAERPGTHRATPTQPGGGPGTADSPPWQRGAAQSTYAAHRPAEPHTGADARLHRFISGADTAGAGASGHRGASARGDGSPAEAYASELPDLSGPTPRTPQRKPTPEGVPETPIPPGGGRAGPPEGREGPEPREDRVQVARRSRGPVRANMQIRRIDPWSVLKVSLLLSVALFFVWMVAVAFLYLVLGGMGVWAKLNSNVGDLLNNNGGSSAELVSSGTIFGGAVLIGLVDIVLLTAMATVAAFVYNLTTDLIGGIEVTLADRD
ncbi:MAG: DUF3566 domain-containing protein [Mycobacterium sp.]|nr:DUF3566 domain-containing protein [Mycobacterium sp.]